MTDTVQNSSNSDDFKLDSRLGYDAMYALYMDEPGAKESDFPNYEDFISSVRDKSLQTKLGFVPSGKASAAAFGGAQIGSFARDVLSGMGGKMSADSFLDSAAKVARTRAQRFAQSAASNIAGGSDSYFSNTDEGDGGTSKADYAGGSQWNPTGLSTNLKPMDTQFNTEIAFTGINKYYLDGQDSNSPLIIKYGVPGLLDPAAGATQDTRIWELFTSAICAEWRREISKRVVVNKQVEEQFTEININNMFNTYLQALAIYYFWQSVIAYTNESRNRNEAMIYLRSTLTPNEYNSLYTLRRLIDSSVIPPFVHKFMHYMMGNYKQSHIPGSPLLKIMPFAFEASQESVFTDIGTIGVPGSTTALRPVAYAINLLEQDSIKGMQNTMARAFPQWCYGDVMDYTPVPRFDPDYLTFWTNAMYVATYLAGGAPFEHLAPSVPEYGDVFVYNLHTDAPDGWVQAMQCVHDGATGSVGPGFFAPLAWFFTGNQASPGTIGSWSSRYIKNGILCKTSCVIFDNNGSGSGFHPVELAQYWQQLSGNTENVFHNTSAIHSFQRFGTERIINMDTLNIRQSGFEFANLMYTSDLQTVPLPGKIQQGGKVMSKSTNRKSSKYGKKSKGKDDASMKDEI